MDLVPDAAAAAATHRRSAFPTLSWVPVRLRLLVALVVVLTIAWAVPASAQPAGGPGGTAPTTVPRLTIPLLSARRMPDLLRERIGEQALTTQLHDLVAKAPATSCLAVSARGRSVYGFNGDNPVEPASANKLLTAFSILHNADPNEKVATTVVAAAAPQNGVVTGDLWLVGGGDALLTTPGYKTTFKFSDQAITPFSDLADRIKATGITEIQGGVIGDDSRFDQQRYVPSWPERFQRQDDVAPLSALEVNDGVTGYTTDPSAKAAVRKPGDPPVLAAATLISLLRARGIAISGEASAGVAPAGTSEVARIESTLLAQVHEMLGWSDNTTAELLGKEQGRRTKGAGTSANGTASTIETLAREGISTAGIIVNDSSGLDDGNRLTCNVLNGVLDREGPTSVIGTGLPVAGRTGTLQKRMRGTVGEGNVSAKTGTLDKPPVASLAGFEHTRQGDTVTFSFVQNGPQLNTDLQDEMVAILYDYPKAPDLTDLVPTAAG
jgi:D-alanyl-D-alanine carboxypeptidase/D-alanyl-D-alanine-endopeptidase (penicillin-binding protein 4)